MAFLQELYHRDNHPICYAVNWCSPCCYHKHHNPKQIVSTLTYELKRRVNVMVDDVDFLLRHLYGYNSVCFLKPATALRFTMPMEPRINFFFENTRHST